MSTIGVTYYQARCDLCGAVDDGGEYSAYSSDGSAIDAAINGDWLQFGPSGRDPLLACQDCQAPLLSCNVCDDDLDPGDWIFPGGQYVQTCPEGHLNSLTLKEAP